MRGIIIGASLALALTQVVLAEEPRSANAMMPGCRSFLSNVVPNALGAFDEGQCSGVMEGLLTAADQIICVPAGVTRNQTIRVVVQYIDQRPQRMHERFATLAYEALKEAWPCKP
jgi:hypothetical protein